MNELDKLVANLAPSKQAEVRFFVQQLLESLEEDYKEMRKKSKVDEVLKEDTSDPWVSYWHSGFLAGIERFEALIQSKKKEL